VTPPTKAFLAHVATQPPWLIERELATGETTFGTSQVDTSVLNELRLHGLIEPKELDRGLLTYELTPTGRRTAREVLRRKQQAT